MWEFVSAAVCLGYVFRRYKIPRYSTQKFSRRSDYMEKAAVAPLKVPWNVKHDEYNPLGEVKETNIWWFHLTRVDGGIRFLVEVSPYTFCRVPVNPFGRTGIIGKGLFPHYGPNNMTLTIIYSKTVGFLKLLYLKQGKFLYTGYLDHPMNTDNAWVEATIYYYELQEYEQQEYEQQEYEQQEYEQQEKQKEQKEQCPEWLNTIVTELIGRGEISHN